MPDHADPEATGPRCQPHERFWRRMMPTCVVIFLSVVSIALHEYFLSRVWHQFLWEYPLDGRPDPHGGEWAQVAGIIVSILAVLIGLAQVIDWLSGFFVKRQAADLKLVGMCLSIVFSTVAFLNSSFELWK